MRKRNKFSLSHYKLLTMDMGEIVPVSWFEALPGDTIQMQTSAFVRVAPTLAPVMTPCHVQFMSFSVPLRLLWADWETFITGGPDGLDASVPPYFVIKSGYTLPTGSIGDYLGLPAGEEYKSDVEFSALPVRAYYRIWNEFFRDQDLQAESLTGLDQDGNGQTNSGASGFKAVSDPPLKVSWRKDYFTVARPFEQKGPAVTIPVQGDANLVGDGAFTFADGSTLTASTPNGSVFRGAGSSPSLAVKTGTLSDPSQYTEQIYKSGIKFDSSTGLTLSVDDIREAFALQRFEEARALFGSRYVEYLRYLGVKSSDARLQRPEYLGGGSQVIQWSEVVQTAPGIDPVGTLRGHGVSAGRTRRWRRFFEEHCIVMTLAWIRPVAVYTQGLSRAWSRTLKEDYWQKELQHIGQQEILTKELYAFGDTPDAVFGFMDRYDEYRSVQNTVCGDFRTTLDYWHLGRVFASQPVLNSDFISCNPSKRIFAEQTADEFYCMFLHSVQARRLISRKGRPGGL